LGLVSPLGNCEEETWNGMLEGLSGAGPIKRFDPTELDVRFACEVKDFDPLEYMDRKEAKRADLYAQYGIAAAELALSNAGYNRASVPADRTGVLIGSGIGGIGTFEEQCKVYLTKGPQRVSPFFVPMFIPDMASGLVSIRIGARGGPTTAPCRHAHRRPTRSVRRLG
jgi:3-oxoacyl-[acyl-carrier-protein] synthase II